MMILANSMNGCHWFLDSQTCSYMWDPVFETNSANPPPMCPGMLKKDLLVEIFSLIFYLIVSTTSGASCILPFNYGGVSTQINRFCLD